MRQELPIPPQPPAETPAGHSNRKRARPRRRPWLFLAAFFFLSALAGMAYLRFAPLPPGGDVRPTAVYGEDGSVIAHLFVGSTPHRYLSLDRIPKALKDAVIASEDAQFYQHGGLNWRGILRALWVDLREGAPVQGGSTITQQLVKNLYLTQDRTWSRKIREAILALQFEMHASKDEILERYLNTVYFGRGATGAASAALTYFGKPLESLDLAECALLAGLPRGPAVYDPIDHFDAAKARQKEVLQAMVRTGVLSPEEADRAWKEPLRFSTKPVPPEEAPYFTDYLARELSARYDVPESALAKGGLSVYTSLDSKLQKWAEEAIRKALAGHDDLQAAFVAMDPRTGDIKAWVGGRDYRESPYDRVLARRQPGSSFKPILYLTALHRGMTPATRLLSEPTTVEYDGGRRYEVHNFGDQYPNRPIGMRQAIARSDNVYAVKTLMTVGPQAVIDTARQLGVTSPMEPYPSLALGTFPVTPLELARAYAAIANGGSRVEPRPIRKVLDGSGRVLAAAEPQVTPVTDAERCFVLTDLMKGIFEPGGTGSRVAGELRGRPLAAKTGSTDTDAWMAGFSPDLVAVAWVGYDRDRLLSASDSLKAAQIWAEVMARAVPPGSPDFAPPKGVVRVAIDPETGALATENCPQVEWDYFVRGTEPLEVCDVHRGNHPPESPGDSPRTPFDHLWRWFQGRLR